MPTDPTARCPCPSGLSYGECHKLINEAADADLPDVSHREYARRWEGNASAYEAQGLYGRLAAHLAGHGRVRRVVDVGCGRGQGLVELAKVTGDGGLLVGIDENPDCLAAAAGRLGVARPAKRLVRAPGPGRQYDMVPLAGLLLEPAPVMLVQADTLLPDPEFEGWIGTITPLDAVTMWFTGVHPARQHDRIVVELGIGDDRTHRLATDLMTMHLATAVLQPGGLLQIVGRGMADSRQYVIDEAMDTMRDLATHGPFEVIDVAAFEYEEPTAGPRIAVGAPGLSGFQRYATSAIMRRTV